MRILAALQIPEILAYHEVFLEELRIRLEGWNKSKCIGDIFLETVSFRFDYVYLQECENMINKFLLFFFIWSAC